MRLWIGKVLFKSHMKCKRFEDILRNLHWIDSSGLAEAEITTRNRNDCFWSVSSLESLLSDRFQSHYSWGVSRWWNANLLGVSIIIRIESSPRCNTLTIFKLYCLNDSRSKYIHAFYLFRGKDSDRREGVSASAFPIVKLSDKSR